MGYYINLEKISLEEYKKILKSEDLLPGRMLLKENIDNNFELLEKQGIKNVAELLDSSKTKKKLQEFSLKSSLDENYLTILIREIKSYHQPPNKLADFPELSEEVISKLEGLAIKNTAQLFEEVLTHEQRTALAQQTGVDYKTILRLTKLTDLSRIRWVNHTFAFVLYEADYDTAKKVADANYEKLYETIKQLNEQRKIYKGSIGKHDMKLCVKAAKDLSPDIKY